ncbi:hypothetical protein GDO78_007566 [Eleutherodactylus coqui]|uniref:Uncharacterized protein n=1 Tax=Eleutherodactylus coqui TaxID=57060 RepID=A0A8J6FGV4_ELECQ|nr:hypothetical protein GDO78_007566 [Eleutherodactylus coqui]
MGRKCLFVPLPKFFCNITSPLSITLHYSTSTSTMYNLYTLILLAVKCRMDTCTGKVTMPVWSRNHLFLLQMLVTQKSHYL